MSSCFCFRNTVNSVNSRLVSDQCMEKLKTSLSDKNVFDILEQSTGDIGMRCFLFLFFSSEFLFIEFAISKFI